MLDKPENPFYNNITEHLFCAKGSAEQITLCRALFFYHKGEINEQ